MEERYTVQELSATMTMEEFVERFHRPEKVWALCSDCSNYGHKWGCPPFEHNVVENLSKYHLVKLFVTKIRFGNEPISPAEREKIMHSELSKIESRLLDLEHECGGLASVDIGGCSRCPKGCTRSDGKPCRHPECVRPSLEAYGFDVAKTLSELFDIELQWSNKYPLPEYQTLACGLFYNAER